MKIRNCGGFRRIETRNASLTAKKIAVGGLPSFFETVSNVTPPFAKNPYPSTVDRSVGVQTAGNVELRRPS
jgi:hypothetical protein